MANCGFVQTTIFLKLAAGLSVIVLILFVVGFGLPSWSTYSSKDVNGTVIEHDVGLWTACICASVGDDSSCSCSSERKVTGILPAIQAIEAAALIGTILTTMLSLMLLCTRGEVMTLKVINLFITASTGIVTLIGIIVYAAKLNDGVENERLGAAFVITTIAGSLCLPLFCLLFIDCSTASKPIEVPLQSKSLQYTTQGDSQVPDV